MKKILRAIIGAGLLVGGLAIGATAAYATTTAVTTGNLQLSIPVTMTITGLAGQTASLNTGAGTTAAFTDLTGITASTNSGTGMSITQQSGAGNHWDTSPPSTNFVLASADTVSIVACPATATCTSAALANNGTPAVLLTTAAATTVSFAIHNVIVVPATLPPGNYYNTEIFTGTAS